MTDRFRLALIREPASAPYGDTIHDPADLAGIASSLLADEAQEIVLLLHLDRRHRIRGIQELSRGGLSEAAVDARPLFGSLLLSGVTAFALVHNHPSGDPTPSADDLALTRRLAKIADLLGFELVDHLIVGEDYASMRALGVI